MTPEFEEALGRWESGELSRDELARRFPDEDVPGLLDAFDGMSAASAAPTPDASLAWAAVRPRLPARLSDRRRGQGKAIRLLAAALVVLLALGATAYAVVPGVRRAMNDAAGAITGESGSSTHLTGSDGSAGAATSQPRPAITEDKVSTTDPDEGVAEENDADADGEGADEQADDDADAGSNPDPDDEADDVASETDSGSGSDEGSPDGGSGSGEEADGGTVDGDGANSGSETAEG
jgi:hypothetical protein